MIIGEIRWVDLPPRPGHTQSGRRPAIIVQSRESTARVPTVLIVPLTSSLNALRFPGTVLIESDPQNSLRHASVALVFQLTAVDQRYVQDCLGNLSTNMLNEIWLTLDQLTERSASKGSSYNVNPN